jgi:hypothetical protein
MWSSKDFTLVVYSISFDWFVYPENTVELSDAKSLQPSRMNATKHQVYGKFCTNAQ